MRPSTQLRILGLRRGLRPAPFRFAGFSRLARRFRLGISLGLWLSLGVALPIAHAQGGAAPPAVPEQAQEAPALFIKSAPPAKELIAVEMANYPPNLALTMTSLQGIVNRIEPRLFLLSGPYDAHWADWFVSRGDVERVRRLDSIQGLQLIEEFRDELAGQVVVDPAVPATINVATMLAGLDRLLITYPNYADNYARRYNLPVVEDLRGRFASNAEAYRWAMENLWPRLNHHALAMLHPSIIVLRDFLIQQNIFVWWQSGTSDGPDLALRFEELQVTHEVLRKSPANIPVLGYPWAGDGVGPGEHGGVSLFSEYGKFLLPSDHAANLSVHVNARPAAPGVLQNPQDLPGRAVPEPDPAKAYISVLMSDGDNIQALINYFPRYWKDSPPRTAPVAWTISPAALDLIPAVVDYYAAVRLPGDYFLASVSGIGYVYLDRYGKSTADPQAALDGFLSLTRNYMERMGLAMIWPMVPQGAVPEQTLRQYAEKIEFLTAIFPDYGQKVGRYEEANRLLAAGGREIPVFHAIGGGTPFAASIRSALQGAPRPAFAHAFALNWNVHPLDLANLERTLGEGFAVVSPADLARMFLSHHRAEQESRQ